MTFDLYGSAPAPKSVQPATTTVDALQAAEWTSIGYDTWELTWSDHTEYLDAVPEDDDAEWMCQLTREDGVWVYDFEHDHRGGPQERNGLGVSGDASVDEAQAACKQSLANWIQRWTDAAGEKRELLQIEGDDE